MSYVKGRSRDVQVRLIIWWTMRFKHPCPLQKLSYIGMSFIATT